MDFESRYEFLEKIGTGSFATVYRARDLELGREVAVKTIHDQYLADFSKLEKYWAEAQLLASLHHPNVVTIFDLHRDRGWLILELMQANLGDKMSGRPMDVRSLKTTVAHVLRAMKYMHARGIVHGDVKPSNMMIDSRKRVKLGDFGLARRVSDEDGSLLKGTTKYMAPEVVSEEFGDVGPASDLYSLGFSAYELLCGDKFEDLFPGLSAFGRNKQVAWMMWHAAPDRRLPEIGRVLEGVPDDLAKVIQKLCEKDQAKRYKSADEALADLNVDQKVIKGGPGGDVADDGDGADAAKKKRLLIAGGAFAVSLLLTFAMLFFSPGGGSDSGKANGPVVRIVAEVYPELGRLKVEDVDRTRAEELEIGPSPSIFLQSDGRNPGRNILLRELAAGDRIEIEREDDGKGGTIVRVTASRPVVTVGALRSVDLAENRVVVRETEGPTRNEFPIRVPDGASVTLNSSPAKLLDVKDGDAVTVTHLNEPGRQGGRVAAKVEVRRKVDATGYVSAIDLTARTLALRFGSPGAEQTLTLPIAPNCTVTLLDSKSGGSTALKIDDLRDNDRVKVQHDVAFLNIAVNRDARRVKATVEQVDVAENRLVVTAEDGRKLTIVVDPATDLTLSVQPATLAALRRGDFVEISYDDADAARLLASAIDAKRPVLHDRWAIVVGVGGYDDRSISKLPYSIDDARLVRDALIRRYAVSPERIVTLIDEPRVVIEKKIAELLKDVRTQTQLIVYFVGHGYLGMDDKAYLAARDANFDRIAETGIPLDWLIDQIEKCPSQDKLLLLDVSHSGTGRDLKSQPSTAELLRKSGQPLTTTFAIASSDAGQRNRLWDDRKHGVFAQFLADGISGDADRDRDLHLTPQELFEFLRAGMTARPIEGQTQAPALFAPGK